MKYDEPYIVHEEQKEGKASFSCFIHRWTKKSKALAWLGLVLPNQQVVTITLKPETMDVVAHNWLIHRGKYGYRKRFAGGVK
jgi:predicted CopG family antitoxin